MSVHRRAEDSWAQNIKPQGRSHMCDGTIKEVLVSVWATALPLFSAEGLPGKS